MEESQMALMIPILGIVLGLGVAMLGIYTSHRATVVRLEHRHKERLAALDKGLELPPDSEESLEAMRRRPRYLLRGLVWLFGGLALAFFLYNVGDRDVSTLGFIPASIGLAYLIFWFAEGKREAQQARAALD